MSEYDWQGLLKSWSRYILSLSDYKEYIPAETIDELNGWIGYPAASDDQITKVENRLKARLPKSYREFLKTSNGWSAAGPYVKRILPVQEIEWVAAKRRNWLEYWKKGLLVGSGFDDLLAFKHILPYDPDLLETGLQISVEDIGIYLLIPSLKSDNGEWQAWLFEGETGVKQYRSFWDLMLTEFENIKI
jgi:hypothetical protein